MAIEKQVLTMSYIAEEDLSSYQYRFIALSTTENYVKAIDSTSEETIGVLQNAPESGQTAVVMILGITKVVAGSALNPGDIVDAEYISATDSGKAIAYTDGERKGVVLVGASAENKYASILLKNN